MTQRHRRVSRLRGEAVVVSGSGSGVGRAIALACTAEGARVAVLGRRREALEATASLAESAGSIVPIVADVSEYASVHEAASRIFVGIGPPRVIVAAAGVHGEITSILDSDPERWESTIQISLAGVYHIVRALIPGMVDRGGWGRMVNVTSASSLGAPHGINSAYPLSKVAVNHFTRQLAAELASTGITVNAVHPGEVKSEMWEAIRADAVAHDEGGARRWAELVEETGGDPPEKSAELVLELCETSRDEVTGRFLWIRDGIQEPQETW